MSGDVRVGCANGKDLLDALSKGPSGLSDEGVDAVICFAGDFLVLVDLEGLTGRRCREWHSGGGVDYLIRKWVGDADLNKRGVARAGKTMCNEVGSETSRTLLEIFVLFSWKFY